MRRRDQRRRFCVPSRRPLRSRFRDLRVEPEWRTFPRVLMKLAFALILALSVVRGVAQGTSAGAGIGAGGSGLQTRGIRGVTYTNLTETTTAQARNFFFAGGVDLRPSTLNQPGGVSATAIAASGPAPAVPPVDRQLKEWAELRAQLATENARLATVITEKRQARQASVAEARQKDSIDLALRQLDRQITARVAALKAGRTR